MNPLIALLKDNKAIVILIVLGAGGYTDILLELGELRATVQYQEMALDDLTERCYRD